MNNIPHIVDTGASIMNATQLADKLENAKSISEIARLVKEKVIPMLRNPAKELTDEEIEGIARANVDGHASMEQLKWFARAILRKAQEK